MSKRVPQPDTVTAREAAAIAGISYPTFQRRVKAGRIAPVAGVNLALEKQRGLRYLRADAERLRVATPHPS